MLRNRYEKHEHLNRRMDTGKNKHFTKKEKWMPQNLLNRKSIPSEIMEMQIQTMMSCLINREVCKSVTIPSAMKDVKQSYYANDRCIPILSIPKYHLRYSMVLNTMPKRKTKTAFLSLVIFITCNFYVISIERSILNLEGLLVYITLVLGIKNEENKISEFLNAFYIAYWLFAITFDPELSTPVFFHEAQASHPHSALSAFLIHRTCAHRKWFSCMSLHLGGLLHSST